ncbi:transglutaminase-like domain-containing protein [soil metagenome]
MNLAFYRTPIGPSDPGSRAALFDDLPHGPDELAGVVQGLLMHQHVASTYPVTLSGAQIEQAHVRSVEEMLAEIVAHDARPLPAVRPARERQVGVCRHFTLLHVAMLRRQGVPARARCGFAAYFSTEKYVDHWVTEYWNEKRGAWVLFDAQLDAHQRALFRTSFDPVDVPRDQFLVAGNCWQMCRAGKAKPMDFGILDLFGWWMIAGNVVRDIAALNNREMLPWDCWGPMPRPDEEPDFALFDRLAALSHAPDAHFDELRDVYATTLSVPPQVMNAVRNRIEAV